jgi:DNA-binding response OmpR family regulator
VLTASDGANGVQAFKQNEPDLVVLDRDMPVMTGSAVLDKIREISATVPVVMLTGYDAPEDAAQYLSTGATAFLSKKDGLLKALTEIDRILGVKKAAPPPVPQRRPEPSRTEPRPASSKGLVLVVDDDDAMRGAVAKFLVSYGYEVLQAEDGVTGMEMARARRPAIVVLDIVMPGKDGVAVLRDLVPEMPDTGFIMLSGNEDEEIARACMKIGAFDYLAKPVNMATLETIVRACFTGGPARR